MMPFSKDEPYTRIAACARAEFQKHGVTLLRADDHAYSPDLFTNVRTYMYGCSFGVAVFDRIESNEFNPNVSLELGFMMGLQKPVCILKDRTLTTLPSDLVGKLYIDFDAHDLTAGLEAEISKWMASNEIDPCRYRLSLHVCLDIDHWVEGHCDPLINYITGLVPAARAPKFETVTKEQGRNWILSFSASSRFMEKFQREYPPERLTRDTGVRITTVDKGDIDSHPLVCHIPANLQR